MTVAPIPHGGSGVEFATEAIPLNRNDPGSSLIDFNIKMVLTRADLEFSIIMIKNSCLKRLTLLRHVSRSLRGVKMNTNPSIKNSNGSAVL